MKKLKIKNQKGITLIALIITIILLLILAIVTISAVNEGNIFAHANNAATKYQEEVAKENAKISEWLTRLEEIDGTPKNFLQKEGLTSPNVIFNKVYTCDNYTRAEGITAIIEVTDNSIVLKENGTIRVQYDEEMLNFFRSIAPQYAAENPEYTEEEWYIIMRDSICPISSDYIVYAEGGGSYHWLLKFSNPGTIEVYYATYEDHIESIDALCDDNYFVGTFTVSES